MVVVNNNVKSKNKILNYLKNIDVSTNYIYDEVELGNYFVIIVMMTINSNTLINNTENFIVYLLFQSKNSNKIFGKFFNREFIDELEANDYYKNLIEKSKLFTNDYINDLIKQNKLK